MTALRWFAPALFCLIVEPLPAQPARNGITQLPPFSDAALHASFQRILQQMDAFHGDSAIALINAAIARLADEDREEERHYLLAYRAEVLYYEGLFNEAMRDLDAAERLAFNLKDSTLIANAFNLKGLLHENIQHSTEALPYLRLAMDWYPARPAARYPVTELHHIHGNLGSYLNNLGRLDSARHHTLTSLALAEAAHAHRAIAVAHWTLGNIALNAGSPDSSLAHFERSWRLADAAKDHDVGVDAMGGIALAHAEAHRTEAAQRALQQALAYLAEHRAQIGLVTARNLARVASRTCKALGDLPGAMSHLGEWHRIDSTITANNIRSALSTQAELLRADNDLEVERMERDRIAAALDWERRMRFLLIVLGLLMFAALTAAYLVVQARTRHRRHLAELKARQAEQERTIAELRVREQVSRDLHDDLGVGLSALKLRSEMALQRGPGDAAAPLLREQASTADELIANMRHIIWSMQDDQGGLEDLVAYIAAYARNYLDPFGIAVDLQVDEHMPALQLTTQQRRNTFLITKEALHNVVKHAQASRVRLSMQWERSLHLAIADNGRGMPSAGNGTQGHGLLNMRKRAGEIGAALSIMGGEAGTVVELRLPQENKS